MPRLYRPPVPVEVKCRVVLRQLGEMFPNRVVEENRADRTVAPAHRKSLGKLLAAKLEDLAALLGCGVVDLRLDHDPPLGARPRRRCGLGKRTFYEPDANDPDHLAYRPHGPRFAGSHLIKTNVCGDHGQHPDRVLIKRERRRASPRNPKTKAKPKRKGRWSSRPLRSAARWPAKGSRRIGRRR